MGVPRRVKPEGLRRQPEQTRETATTVARILRQENCRDPKKTYGKLGEHQRLPHTALASALPRTLARGADLAKR